MAMTREESGTRAGFEIDLGMQCAGERVRNDAYSTELAMYIIETRRRGCSPANARVKRWHVFFVPFSIHSLWSSRNNCL
jgi:hypothetical protein